MWLADLRANFKSEVIKMTLLEAFWIVAEVIWKIFLLALGGYAFWGFGKLIWDILNY